MENPGVDRSAPAEDGNQLNRNRSFKSKQLVRSQAIRESTSPPRTISPSMRSEEPPRNPPVNARVTDREDNFDCRLAKQRVEIQITSNTWESESSSMRGTRRRVTADLLSNNPRVACICGTCNACPHCRGRRRRPKCPTKQDSGIVCSDDCPDYSDSEGNGNELKKSNSGSLDVDEFYCRCAERKDKPKNNSLSRNDSDDRTELFGPDLVSFIKETLNKNGRDRNALLKIEKELHNFINDTGRCIVKFPVMSSYGRMLVHRCAALFQLAHHIEPANKTCVVVSKSGTSGGRIPCTDFKTWCVATFPPSPIRHHDPMLAKSILKRDTSLDTSAGAEGALARSKSLEQREKDYERVRRRIFSEDNCHHDDSQWPWMGGPIKLLTPEPGRNKLLKVQSLENPPTGVGASAPVPPSWRNVSKSHSFGGYGDRTQHRTLSRQGDLASSSWRLSPSSSGYKTLSLRSTDSVTPSPTGGGTPEPSHIQESPALVWAVTDLSTVPPGALVIHPQTGRPLTNPDGSVYHFDPANPPVLYDPNVYIQTEHNKIDQNNEKRRGRLEKQHSFMDNENECQTSEECRSKCCCECKHEHTQNVEKPLEKEPSKPPSPKLAEQIETTNQTQEEPKYENESSFDVNHSQDVAQYNAYTQHYAEEAPVQQINPYLHQEVANMGIIPQAKVTPIPIQDHNIRPMSLTNVMYQPTMQPQYAPYITNQRMDQMPQQLYQPIMQQQVEEQKQITSTQDNTFRIDPSYPYPAVDYSGACGGCIDTQPPRSFSVPYGQVEVPAIIPQYPVHNVLHLPHYPVQYQDPVQWSNMQQTHKLYEMCPVVYPQAYPHYNIVYPQVVQQPYQICPPIYPVPEKDTPSHTRNYYRNMTSLPPTPRATPGCDDTDKDDRQNSTEIAVKIQQIKEQMASLNTRQRASPQRQWRRNTGNGILGNCPQYDIHHSRSNEEGQLSNAARAIVNSIRNMQSKNTYHQQDKRPFDNRRRYDREHDRNTDRHSTDRQDNTNTHNIHRGEERKFQPRNVMNQVNMPYRPQYLYRQMSPSTWCRRSPAPVHPGVNPPRRAPPDNRPRR